MTSPDFPNSSLLDKVEHDVSVFRMPKGNKCHSFTFKITKEKKRKEAGTVRYIHIHETDR